MQEVPIQQLHCHRRIYTWTPRRARIRRCPRCKSTLWDVAKIRPVKLGTGLGIGEILTPHIAEIQRLGRRYGVERVMVFGSVRRSEATETSDIDLMVRWKKPVSLLTRSGLQLDLEKTLGRPVDLVNEGGLYWAIAPQIEAEAVPL